MNYILKQFDEPLVKFSATTDTSEPEIQILWTNEEAHYDSVFRNDLYPASINCCCSYLLSSILDVFIAFCKIGNRYPRLGAFVPKFW